MNTQVSNGTDNQQPTMDENAEPIETFGLFHNNIGTLGKDKKFLDRPKPLIGPKPKQSNNSYPTPTPPTATYEATPIMAKLDALVETKDVMDRLDSKLQHWITNSLNLSTIAGIRKVYDEVIEDTLSLVETRVSNTPEMKGALPQFETRMKSRLEVEVKPIMTDLWEVMISFQTTMDREFECKIFFPEREIDDEIRKAIETTSQNKSAGKIHIKFEKFKTKACTALGRNYKSHNQHVLQNYEEIVHKCIEIASRRYEMEMEILYRTGTRSPEVLEKFHVHLLEKFETDFRLLLNNLNQDQVCVWSKKLKATIEIKRREFLKKVMTALEKNLASTRTLLTVWDNRYKNIMEERLESLGCVNQDQIRQYQEALHIKTLAATKVSLVDILNFIEPDSYLHQSLQQQFNKSEALFLEKNKAKLEKQRTPGEMQNEKKSPDSGYQSDSPKIVTEQKQKKAGFKFFK